MFFFSRTSSQGRRSIKLCIKNYIKCVTTFEMLALACDKSTIRSRSSQLWYKQFKEDREDVNGDACPGHPSTSTTEAVKKMILEYRRITMRGVADDVDMPFES